MIRRFAACAAALLTLFVATSVFAAAGDFGIDVTVLRPAFMREGNLREMSPTNTAPIWKAASFQLMEVQDTATRSCGFAFTNDYGEFPSGTTFNCGDGKRPTGVRLVAYGDGMRGFKVGTNSAEDFIAAAAACLFSMNIACPSAVDDALRIVRAWRWFTNFVPTNNSATVSIGPWQLGGTDRTSANFRAAAVVDLVDASYDELALGLTLGTPTTWLWSAWLPADVLSEVISVFQSWGGSKGTPWTYWNTVHMPPQWPTFSSTTAGVRTAGVLEAVPHELGHVLYNMKHSDQVHYLQEVLGFIKDHDDCREQPYAFFLTEQFANYEGFASTVRSLMWRHHAAGSSTTSEYADYWGVNCKGLTYEGVVKAFYSSAFAGGSLSTTDEPPPIATHEWTTGRIGANRYSFPPISELVQMVVDSKGSEIVDQMWANSLKKLCTGGEAGAPKAPRYCGSRRFKCFVKNTLLKPNDYLSKDSFFKDATCEPGVASITKISNDGKDRYTVTFSSDYADSYELEVYNNGSVTKTSSTPDTHESFVNEISLTRCKQSKLRVRAHVKDVSGNDSVSAWKETLYTADINSNLVDPQSWLPGGAAITSVVAQGSQTGPLRTYVVTHETPKSAKSYRIFVNEKPADSSPHAGGQVTVSVPQDGHYYFHVESQNDCGVVRGPSFCTPDDACKAAKALSDSGKPAAKKAAAQKAAEKTPVPSPGPVEEKAKKTNAQGKAKAR